MTTDYKSIDVWRKICSTTLNNYIHMEKRLSESRKMSNFILTYYSIFLIINSLTAVYFEWYSDQMCEYFGVIISVIMLAYSLINSNANYSQRIDNVTKAINDLKTLKRKLKEDGLDAFIVEYNEIVDNVEFRSDLDFFNTVKSLCKEKNINCFQKPSKIVVNEDEDVKKIKNYLSELSPVFLQIKIIANIALKGLLLILPIIVVVVCIIF